MLVLQGWVRITQPIVGSVDGLLLIDSLSGEALAQRVNTTDVWRQFTMYRAAPRSGPMNLTFALTGMGEVWIDDVTIQVIKRGGQPQQARQSPTATNASATCDVRAPQLQPAGAAIEGVDQPHGLTQFGALHAQSGSSTCHRLPKSSVQTSGLSPSLSPVRASLASSVSRKSRLSVRIAQSEWFSPATFASGDGL